MKDEQLTDLAVDLVIATMASVSTDKIQPLEWWPRAKAALVVGAAIAETWPQMIGKMGDKLQLGTLKLKSSKEIAKIGLALNDADAFERFRFLCERDALYIVAMAQAKRAEQRSKSKAKSERTKLKNEEDRNEDEQEDGDDE